MRPSCSLIGKKALGGVDPEGNPYNMDLNWFFDQWIRGVGLPQYRMTYDVRETEDGSWLVEGLIEQRVVNGSSRNYNVLEGQYYRGVVDLTVTAGGEEYEARRIVEGPQTPFKLKVPVEFTVRGDGKATEHRATWPADFPGTTRACLDEVLAQARFNCPLSGSGAHLYCL